jgi:hypothetical protein
LFDRLKTQHTINGELCTIFSHNVQTFIVVVVVVVSTVVVEDGFTVGLTVADMARMVDLWVIDIKRYFRIIVVVENAVTLLDERTTAATEEKDS